MKSYNALWKRRPKPQPVYAKITYEPGTVFTANLDELTAIGERIGYTFNMMLIDAQTMQCLSLPKMVHLLSLPPQAERYRVMMLLYMRKQLTELSLTRSSAAVSRKVLKMAEALGARSTQRFDVEWCLNEIHFWLTSNGWLT